MKSECPHCAMEVEIVGGKFSTHEHSECQLVCRSSGQQAFKKIVAFLQNPYFKPITQKWVIQKYNTDQLFHKRILAGSVTGRRLLSAFGDHLFGSIYWDNISLDHGFASTHVGKPQPDHVLKVLRDQQPCVVIAFGRLARLGLEGLLPVPGTVLEGGRQYGKATRAAIRLLTFSHPVARGISKAGLVEFADQVREAATCG